MSECELDLLMDQINEIEYERRRKKLRVAPALIPCQKEWR